MDLVQPNLSIQVSVIVHSMKLQLPTDENLMSIFFFFAVVVTESGCEILTAREGASKADMTWSLEAIQR